ncbi:MAG: elongation factor P [Nitrospirae bacterium]|nr:elongation factor P [Nitrospirota bacterium]
MIPATQLKVGMIIYYEGKLCRVSEIQHVTPGNWRGMVQTKIRNIATGRTLDHRFRSEDQVDVAVLERKDMEYLYLDGENYVFMDSKTFDQLSLHKDIVGEATNYLLPNTTVTVDFCDEKPTAVEPPTQVALTVVETDPSLAGATQSASKKPAKLETGLMVQVPQFVVTGEKIMIDTRDNSFLQRVKA